MFEDDECGPRDAVILDDAVAEDPFDGIPESVWLALHAEPPDDLEPGEPLSDAERLAVALAAGPGPAAAAHLAAVDPRGLLAPDKVRLVQAWEAQIAAAQAGQARALALLDTPHPDDEPTLVLDPTVTDVEVRAALRLTPGAASGRLHLARELVDRLAPTAQALTAGRISWAHVQVLDQELAGLTDPDLLAAVQADALRLAALRTPAATRAAVARLVLTADPDAARDRHDRARADRHVRVFPLPDGMSCLQVTAPAEQVHRAWHALTHAAHAQGSDGSPTDGDNIDARRADLALALLHTADAAQPTPRQPRVLVTVAASTLLGCDDQPAALTGHGWITADAARRVAADATWQRLLTDPTTGAVLDVGRTTYRPPADLARHVTLRDRTCRAPHCPRPAHHCDLDHALPYTSGGTTSATNLHPLCRHDHRAKTTGGWTLTRHPDGTTTWTSARGITHHVPPPEPPPHTRDAATTTTTSPDNPDPAQARRAEPEPDPPF